MAQVVFYMLGRWEEVVVVCQYHCFRVSCTVIRSRGYSGNDVPRGRVCNQNAAEHLRWSLVLSTSLRTLVFADLQFLNKAMNVEDKLGKRYLPAHYIS